MKHILASVLFLASVGANAQTYLVLPDLKTAQDRSAQQCAALKCDGVNTKYWWPVQPLTDGTAAIVIDPAGPFGSSHTVNGKAGALTPGEVSALKTPAQVAPVMPANPAMDGVSAGGADIPK